MTYQECVVRQTGQLAAALIVEGMPFMFTTNDESWALYNRDAGVNFPVQLSGALQEEGLSWLYEIDYKHGDLKMPGMTFVLQDLDFSDTTGVHTLRLTYLMGGPQAAVRSEIAATIATGDTEITLNAAPMGEMSDDTAWTATGYAYSDREAFRYTGKDAGANQLTGVVHGVFYSEPEEHTYTAPDPNARRPSLGTVPVISDRPISWYGRRVKLLIAEILSDGTMSQATEVWGGVVRGDVEPDETMLRWKVPCTSRWDLLNTEILADQPTCIPRGFNFAELVAAGTPLLWFAQEVATGAWTSGSFNLADADGLYGAAEDVLADLTSAFNASLVAAGVTDQFRFYVEGGYVKWKQGLPEAGDGAYTVQLQMRDQHRALADSFFDGALALQMPHNADEVYSSAALAPDYSFQLYFDRTTRISVDDTTGFVAIRPGIDAGAQGDGYRVESWVVIGDAWARLEEVDAGGNALVVRAYIFESGAENLPVLIRGKAQVTVKQALVVSGQLWDYWRYGFIENTLVPTAWKGGIRSSDFDWDGMALHLNGDIDERFRIITGPTNFRTLFLQDLGFSGLVPAVGVNAKISARLASAPHLAASVGAINDYAEKAGEPVTYSPVVDAIFSRFSVKHTPTWRNLTEPFEFSIVSGTVRQAYGQAQARTLTIDGLFNFTLDVVSTRVYWLGQQFLEWFGNPNAMAGIPCTLRAALVLPGDTVELSHWALPNPDTGERGVSNVVARVVSVRVAPLANSVHVVVMWKLTGRHGGIAPAARIIDYDDLGAGTEPQRYRLRFDPGLYVDHSPPGADGGIYDTDDEGAWFATLPLAKVELRSLDDATPLRGSLTLTSSPFDGADGLYVDSAIPGAVAALIAGGGEVVLTLDEYATAAQTADAQVYCHVCDEDDFLIQDGDLGFKAG